MERRSLEALEAGNAGMPTFLFVSAIANAVFLVRVVKDLRGDTALAGSPSVAMLLSACAELCWVLPCFIQCVLVFFVGDEELGDFSPLQSFGCDFQGFYSVLGSIAGMLSGMLIAAFTFMASVGSASGKGDLAAKLPSKRFTSLVALAIFFTAVIVALLPIVAFDHYLNTDEGFCYIDWHDGAQSGIMFAFTLPTFVVTLGLFGRALASGGWPNTLDLVLLIASFISAWALWLPASIMGFAQAPFPGGYHIAGGILGHAQALINPYLYGIRWRDSLLALGGELPLHKTGVDSPIGGVDLPAVSPTPPSLPASPPSSVRHIDVPAAPEPEPAFVSTRKLAWGEEA